MSENKASFITQEVPFCFFSIIYQGKVIVVGIEKVVLPSIKYLAHYSNRH